MNGRIVRTEEFVDGLVQEVARRVGRQLQRPDQLSKQWPVGARSEFQEVRETKPQAVGINEAAKLIGLSPWTIRAYVARRIIRPIRVGSRVLIPMEVLERVSVEGLNWKGKDNRVV